MAGFDSDTFPVLPDRPLEPGALPFGRQDCAPGYHRGKLPENDGWGPCPLLAPCVPCSCNNHGDVCDLETGQCLVFIIRATVCPLHFMCKRDDGLWAELVCVFLVGADCPVYTCCPRFGRCSIGYHGNPRAAGGSCQKCDCNPQGSVHSDCDHTSGQCVCKPGATGLCCEECRPRHTLTESDCVCRAAKELLSRIQKRFQKPQEKLKALKEAASGLFSYHSEELQAAEELLRETETKIQESSGLLLLIKASLREFGPTTQVWKS